MPICLLIIRTTVTSFLCKYPTAIPGILTRFKLTCLLFFEKKSDVHFVNYVILIFYYLLPFYTF